MITYFEDRQSERDDNGHWRVHTRGGRIAIVNTYRAPDPWPIRGWFEDDPNTNVSWTAEGHWSSIDRGLDDLVAEAPKRKVPIELVVDIDTGSGIVVAVQQHLPQGLRAVPVLVRLIESNGKTARGTLKGEIEI